MQKILFLLIGCLLAVTASAQNFTSSEVNRTLNQLDEAIARRYYYIAKRNNQIDSLRSLIPEAQSVDTVIAAYQSLGDAFLAFNNDSALVYYTKGYDIAEANGFSRQANLLRLKRAVNLPLSGFMAESRQEFEQIDTTAFSVDDMPTYYEAGRQLYSYIASFFKQYESGNYWNNFELEFLKKYIDLDPVGDPYYEINQASDLIKKGQLSQARNILIAFTDSISPESNLYARASNLLAQIAKERGEDNAERYYLARSAIADLKSSVLEVTSLQELGVIMSHDHDINRAYRYLSTALINAVDCNAAVRIVQTSSSLPLIQQAHNDQIARWRTGIYLFIILLGILLCVLIAALVYLRNQKQRTSAIKDRLQSANQLKDIYISQFFRLSSIYVDKLNQLCKIVNRKISAGQVDELYKMTKSNKFIEDQAQDFYHLFDDAFLHIYPNFVNQVNDLLRDPIQLKEGELLNNDLRILAFMRLGLDDTNQVAQILNYSVNTIYAYRNKLRNRAYDRDNFEINVMQIPSI